MLAKQSTAATLIVGPILDSTGAEYTSAVIGDLSISKNGGTLTALAAAATLTHIANGQYTLELTIDNLDTLGRLQITCNKSTYQMPPIGLVIVPAMVFDSMVLGTDVLQSDVTQFGGTNLTAASGIPEVKVASIANDAITAAAIADAAIDTATFAAGTTIPQVTLVDTCTTNADMRGTDNANTTVPDNAGIADILTRLPDAPPGGEDGLPVLNADLKVAAALDSTTSAKIDSILEDTGTTLPTQIAALNDLSSADIEAALGTGTWATAIPWNASWDAEVQSEVQDAIEVNNLDHLLKIAVDTNFATTVHLDSVLGHIADNGTSATFSRSTDSLEAIRDRGDAAWTTGAGGGSGGASLEDIIAGVQSVSGAIVEAQNSATLSIRIGDTWTQDIESLGDLTDKTVTFAMKRRASDADTAAIVFITEGTGLTRLNGAATTAGWGSIEILDEVAGDIRLRLESDATSLLTSGSYVDAVKLLEDGDDRSPRNAGRTVVSAGVIADIT